MARISLVSVAVVALSISGVAWGQVATGTPAPAPDPDRWVERNAGMVEEFVAALAVAPSHPSIFYVGTDLGEVYKSSDSGNSWMRVATFPSNPSVSALAIDPTNANIIYAGVWGLGVYKSSDGGDSWVEAAAGMSKQSVAALAIDPTNPSIVYAGTAEAGVYRSSNGGSSWLQTSTGLGNQWIYALAIDPSNPSTVYVGTFGGGVYKSDNGGNLWVPANVGIGSRAVRALAIDPTNSSILYAGLISGVYRSSDGGSSWVRAGPGPGRTLVYSLAIDPSNPSIIYAATIDGVIRAFAQGWRWIPWNEGLPTGSVRWARSLALAGSQGEAAALVLRTLSGIFLRPLGSPSPCAYEIDLGSAVPVSVAGSTIGAADLHSFGSCGTGGRRAPEMAYHWVPPSTGTYVFDTTGSEFDTVLFVRDGDCTGRELACDDDGGEGVTSRTVVGLAAGQTVAVIVDGFENASGAFNLNIQRLAAPSATPTPVHTPTSAVRTPTNAAVWTPTPRGFDEWVRVSSGLGSRVVTALAIDPVDPSIVYVGTDDSEVYKSSNGGGSWVQATTGMGNRGVYALAIDPSNPSTVYVGTSGGGVYKSSDGGTSWAQANAGMENREVVALAIAPSSPSIIYAGTAYVWSSVGVYRSSNGGDSWMLATAGPENQWVYALAIDPSNPSTVYVGTSGGGVYKSSDGGTSWAQATAGIDGNDVSALAIDPSNPSIIYAGTFGVGVYKSSDGGISWEEATRGMGNQDVFALAIDPSNPSIVYAGTWAAGVYKSSDGGNSWAQATTGIGDQSVRALAIAPSSPNIIYAGTDSGVYAIGQVLAPTYTPTYTLTPVSTPTPGAAATPGAFALSTPANDAWCQPNCCFSWQAAAGAASYTLLIEGWSPIPDIHSTQYCLPADTELPESELTWSVRACAAPGHCRDSFPFSVRIDATPPSTFDILDPPNSSWRSRNAGLTFRWQPSDDTRAGLQGYELLIDGTVRASVPGTQTELIVDTSSPTALRTALGDGGYIWAVQAVDKAGNRRESTTSRLLRMDSTPPSFPWFIGTPARDVWLADSSPRFEWVAAVDAQSGIAAHLLVVDGATFPAGPSTTALTPPMTFFEGTHGWHVAAVDIAGNVRGHNNYFYFGIDKSAPTGLSLMSPADGTIGNLRTPELCWTPPTDGYSGLDVVRLIVNGTVQDVTSITSGCTTPQPPLPPGDGRYPWYVEAVDRVGNIARTETRTYIIDNLPPTAPEPLSPACGSTLAQARPLFSWTEATDEGSGVARYELTLDGGAGGICDPCVIDPPTTSFRPTVDLGSGPYNWRVKAVDGSGRETTSVDCTLTLAVTPIATPTPSATPTGTREPQVCTGDCDGSGAVTVDEVVTVTSVALGTRALADCRAGDRNADGVVTVDEIVATVHHALDGCP